MGFAVELHQLLQHHGPSRHIDAQCQRLGREDDLDQAPDEGLFNAFLEGGQHARVVRGHSPAQALSEDVVVKRPQIAV